MEKNEILEAARKSNEKGKEYEKVTGMKANLLSAIITISLATIFFISEIIVKDETNYSLLAVLMTFSGTQRLYEGIKKRKKFDIIIGSIELVAAIWATVLFMLGLIK